MQINSTSDLAVWCEKNLAYQQQIQKSVNSKEDIYSFAKELTDPYQPLRTNLKIVETAEAVFKYVVRTGSRGKVRIESFNNDPEVNKLYAIKRPLHRVDKESHFNYYLTSYENNLQVSLRLGDQPYFMKVYGIVIKKGKRHGRNCSFNLKTAFNLKPYLVLSYIEGTPLRVCATTLTLEQKMHILAQLKDALLMLYDAGIHVSDLYENDNVIITKDCQLKFIDYDSWEVELSSDKTKLVSNLSRAAEEVISGLEKGKMEKIIIQSEIKNFFGKQKPSESSKEYLKQTLDNLISAYRSVYSPSCTIL